MSRSLSALARLEALAGKRLGDAADPLLVSVRSGARESMPGMLDTVLNLGLNDDTVIGLAERSGSERFAWDSYRRFAQMFGNVVLGVPGERFERGDRGDEGGARSRARHRARRRRAAPLDGRVPELLRVPARSARSSLRARSARCSTPGRVSARSPTGASTAYLMTGERRSTCSRWSSAISARAVAAASRSRATRSPARREPSGDFLANAQGEDVVSGVRTPRDISELRAWLPEVYEQLTEILRTLERHYGDMQDTEFTVQDGRLYMLQTRNAKRPAQAAVRFAVDAVGEGLLDREAALLTIDRPRSTRCCTRRSTRAPTTRRSRPVSPPHRGRRRARSC